MFWSDFKLSKSEFPKNTQEWIHWIFQSRVLRTVKLEIETHDDEHSDYWKDDVEDGYDDGANMAIKDMMMMMMKKMNIVILMVLQAKGCCTIAHFDDNQK